VDTVLLNDLSVLVHSKQSCFCAASHWRPECVNQNYCNFALVSVILVNGWQYFYKLIAVICDVWIPYCTNCRCQRPLPTPPLFSCQNWVTRWAECLTRVALKGILRITPHADLPTDVLSILYATSCVIPVPGCFWPYYIPNIFSLDFIHHELRVFSKCLTYHIAKIS
jgi:hypothetical protein